ncbi:hypothetical protein JW960_25690 [candidate division KSB1 bacterium]|nr:hypothetical protein [candidate division KSB1 bacterium]
MNRRLFIIIILLAYCIPVCHAEEHHDIPDNYTILMMLADSIDTEVVSRLTLESDSDIAIKAISKRNEREWFFEARLIHAMLSNNFQVSIVDSTIQLQNINPDIICEYQIQRFQIEYESVGGFFRRSRVQRHIDMQVAFNLINGHNQRIIWSGTICKDFHDEIPFGKIKNVERPELSITQAQLPRKLGIKEWMDALLVASATGAVIYSFYVFRSK